jgi:hypothetical protein
MNQELEKILEAQIDRALKQLPDLQAPSALRKRIMRVIELRAELPWYRRSWQLWPRPLQVFSLGLLLAMFCGLSFAGGRLPHVISSLSPVQTIGGWLAGLSVILNAIGVVLGAIIMAIKRLGLGFILGCLTALALGYAMCIGLGTLCVRIGVARGGRH